LNAGLLPDLLAWLELDAAALQQAPGIGKTRADRLAASFALARQRPLGQWLKALGIPASISLAPETDWDVLAARSLEQWLSEPGIGPTRADRLHNFFRTADLQPLRHRLRAAGVSGF
jgi:DNA ligase (NAD+)